MIFFYISAIEFERVICCFCMHTIQSVIFDKFMWSEHQAKLWLNRNGLKYDKIDTTENTMRFRQFDTQATVQNPRYNRYKFVTKTIYSGSRSNSKKIRLILKIKR